MNFNIAALPGDGVGPEVSAEAIKVLQAVGEKFGHKFNLEYGHIGGIAIDETGSALPSETLKLCKRADAVLLGAVGGPKWDDPQAKVHPEDGLLSIRNIKPDVIRGVDFIFVRELTGGLYFGKPKKQWVTARGRKATDSMTYSEQEIERIVRVGFELARTRGKKLVSVDKANVLQSSRLWRQVAAEVGENYPDIELENMLVDSCAMRIIQNPTYFDVVVTENTFGDILTDEASMLAGSMGMLPSASLAGVPQQGIKIAGMYEPIHGSAPRRAGLNMANPIATILSVAMMLRYSCNLVAEAEIIEKTVDEVLEEGYRTYDIMDEGKNKVGTKEMGDLISEKIRR